ncbi:MAG: hypothetical protein ACI4TK_05850 [Agathobacter sp.]
MGNIKPIGEALSPILAEIEETLWQHEATLATKPEYTEDGFRAGMKIFISVVLDKMFDKQMAEGLSIEEMQEQATVCGEEIRALVQKYTGIDSVKLYKELRNGSKERDN